MTRILLLALLLTCLPCAAATSEFKVVGQWSETVDGLRGRLQLSEGARSDAGTRTAIVHLELENVALGDSIHIHYDASKSPFRPALRDGAGKDVKNWISTISALPTPCWLVLPVESVLRFRMGFSAIDPEEPGLFIIAGFMGGKWFIPGAVTNDYFLSATFTATIPKEEERPRMWKGTLELPPIKIPKDTE